MNRQIKFRAFENGKMFSWEDMKNRTQGSGSEGITLDYPLYMLSNGYDIEWMQYTGLKDKNGVEIYEGDIVKDGFGRIMRVGFWNYRLCWIAISETNFHHADFYDWIVREERTDNDTFPPVRTETEIIGNIYQHPNLIS